MPYLGKSPNHGNFTELTDVSGSFDGSTTQFALTSRIGGVAITPVIEAAVLISINGVIQEPTTDYTVSGTNITFTSAPASTDSFFGTVMGFQLDVGTPSDSTITQAKLASTFLTGATDIGAAIVDADLLLIDDGAGGTFRKTTASRLTTYIDKANPASADGDTLGTASLEWSDLYLADGGVIYLGNDQDVTLTHVADTGILLNSTMQLQFNDSSQYINAPSNAILDINATDEIELNATAVDLNGTLDVSGATTAAAITASGIIKTDDATDATSTTDGSLQTDGGLSVVKDAVFGDDLLLLSDASVIKFGANSEVTLTHTHNVGLLLSGTTATDSYSEFRITDGNAGYAWQVRSDSAQSIATGSFVLNDVDSSSFPVVINEGAATNTLKIDSSNDVSVINDLKLASDSSVLKFGADGDVTLTHAADASLTLAGGTAAQLIMSTGSILPKTDTDTSNSGSVTLNFQTNQNFVLTFTGNVTLANPSTETAGQSGVIVCIQDGTGSRTLSLGTDYETAGGAGITLSTAANAVDVIPYFVKAAGSIQLGAVQKAFS